MLVWFATHRRARRARHHACESRHSHSRSTRGTRCEFFLAHPRLSFVALGAVVLVVTGGEALYADMGHFGPKPIRIVWYWFVLPALLLNYFGQGALLLRTPSAIANPFYLLAPSWFVYPLLVIATSAAVVASQALISGAFSLTQQAIQLGYSPRMRIIHTSKQEAGQIYIPEVNKALAVGTLLLVLGFRSATAFGAAYGVAVSGTMAITSILFYMVVRAPVGLVAAQGGLVPRVLPVDRPRVLPREPGSRSRTGGWVPLAVAVFGLHAHDDVEAWPSDPARDPAARYGADRHVPRRRRTAEAGAREGHGGLHDLGGRTARRSFCCTT